MFLVETHPTNRDRRGPGFTSRMSYGAGIIADGIDPGGPNPTARGPQRGPPLFPSRTEIVDRLQALLDGADRAATTDWAETYIAVHNDASVTDGEAWEVLEALTAADAPTADREYLYGPDDFRAWLTRLT